MEMDICVQTVSESLDKGDRPALGSIDTVIARAVAEESEDGKDEDIENRSGHVRVVGQPVAKRMRKRQRIVGTSAMREV